MANLSRLRRERMLEFLMDLKIENRHDEKILQSINEIENELNEKRYGLVWEEHSEEVDEKMLDNAPILVEDKSREIATSSDDEHFNFLIEGDNLHSLKLLEKTHREKIDVIYIDPPYNRGKQDFIYDDAYISEDDGYRHSKWLSFMDRRLRIAKELLSPTGAIIINIDEHESSTLLCLLQDIFGENNNIGEIIWNKQNPKGDSNGVATMHETIFIFCKDKESFLSQSNVCTRKKPNAEAMISKAQSLFKKIGKRIIPEEVSSAIKPFNYSDNIKKDFYVTYDLSLVNKEFQNWLSRQKFSAGEKAYKYIDETGRIYRGVSMAWPNKKKAPDDYFIPLIHPITGKPCPVPDRGWRNPPATMDLLLRQGRILFGEDETKQPERKYFLDENMYENVPSIYENADSADEMLEQIGVHFDYPKPVSEAIYVCSVINPNASLFLDFFAGSGTTAHAILEMNKLDGKKRHFILCTSNDEKERICDEITFPRLKTVITGIRQDGKKYSDGIPANLKYYKTGFVPYNSENFVDDLIKHTDEMIQLEYGVQIDKDKYISILTDAEADELQENWNNYPNIKAIYVSRHVLLDAKQKDLFYTKDVYIIPDYYYREELREVGE